jgi:hypothetical protein
MVTLPGDLERIMGIAVNGHPVQMRSPWFEFVQDGPGQVNDFSGAEMVLDRGESCTFRDIPPDSGQYFLQVKGRIDERISGVRPKIRVLGYDEFGDWVRTEDVAEPFDGIDIEIDGDSTEKVIETSFAWSRIEAVIKPLTKSYVQLWVRSVAAGTFMISSYAPRETVPTYRRYFLPSISPRSAIASGIVMRVRRRFFPVISDNDFLPITNLVALETMMQATQSRENKDADAYMKFRGLALNLMGDEATAYRGPVAGPTITFENGFGMSGVDHVQ